MFAPLQVLCGPNGPNEGMVPVCLYSSGSAFQLIHCPVGEHNMEPRIICENVLRAIIFSILLIAFVLMVIKCIFRLNLEETTFVSKEVHGIYFPIFTICPDTSTQTLSPSDNKTFEDFEEIITKSKQYFSAQFYKISNNGYDKHYNLSDKYVLEREMNTSFDEVWSFVVAPHFKPFYLSVCAQIDVHSIMIGQNDFAWIEITIKDHGANYYSIVTSDFQESKHSSLTIWGGDSVGVSNKHTYYARRLKMQSIKRIKTKSHFCDRNKPTPIETCINEYISQSISCCPSWIKSCRERLQNCSGQKHLEDFMKLSKDLSTNVTIVEKCFVPKCDTNEWITTSELDFNYLISEGNGTMLEYVIPQKAMIEERVETLLYSHINLIADFGGYLGLFLGASIFSLFDICSSFICRAFHTSHTPK